MYPKGVTRRRTSASYPIWDLIERYVAAEKTVRIVPNRSVKISGA
jgi:hypothetical protein